MSETPCDQDLYDNGEAIVLRALANKSAKEIERHVKRLRRHMSKVGLVVDWHYAAGWPVLRIGHRP